MKRALPVRADRLIALGPGALLRALALADRVRPADETDDALVARRDRWASLQGYLPKADEPGTADSADWEPGQDDRSGDSRAASPVADELPQADRPPLTTTFFALTGYRKLDSEPEESREALATRTTRQRLTREMCRAVAPVPPYVPLVRPKKLWPVVSRSLAVHWPGGLDLQRLTRDLAHARLPQRLPQRDESGWATRLHVVWDRAEHLWPYHEDYLLLLNQIRHLHGETGLAVWQVNALPSQVESALRPGQAGRRGEWVPVPEPRIGSGTLNTGVEAALAPAAGSTVVLLGDAGSLAWDAAGSQQWVAWLATLRQRGCRVVVWAPCGPSWVWPDLTRHARIHCLQPGPALASPVRRLPNGTPASQVTSQERRADLRDRLLTRAAVCLHLAPAMLRGLRQGDARLAREPAVESWAWSAGPLVRRSLVSRALTGPVRQSYLSRFQALPASEQAEILACVWRGHRHLGRSTAVVEALTWKAHADARAVGTASDLMQTADTWMDAYLTTVEEDAAAGRKPVAQAAYAADVLARVGADSRLMAHQARWASRMVLTGGLLEVPAGIPAAALAQAASILSPARERLKLWPCTKGDQLLLAGSGTAEPRDGLHPGWVIETAHCVVTRSDGSRELLAQPAWAVPLAWRGVAGQQVVVRSDAAEFVVTELTRPPWATEWGRDRFGLFATLEVAGIPQRLRHLPPGRFLMGSPANEPGRDSDEGPQQEVTLTCGFWLADTCCTQALWQAVMGDKNPSHFKGDPALPVDSVSWDDVQTFLGRLQRQLPPGVEAVLPTEAQWEYACRAGTTTPYNVGDTLTPEQANFGRKLSKTVPVKSLPANPWGLYEMHGNLWEWCADARRSYAAEPVEDPDGGQDGVYRVLRGGSWLDEASWARSAFRFQDHRDDREQYFGFRFALRSIEPGAGGGTGSGRAEPATGLPQAEPGAGVGPAEPGARIAAAVGKFFKPTK